MGGGISLTIPTNANERTTWGWRGRNYWAHAKRPASTSAFDRYWGVYVSSRHVNAVNVVWDDNEPSWQDCVFRHSSLTIVLKRNVYRSDPITNGTTRRVMTKTASIVTFLIHVKIVFQVHVTHGCTSTQDSTCQPCPGQCSAGQQPAADCVCANCVAGVNWKAGVGSGTCTVCSTGACGVGQRRSECTIFADFSCQACSQACGPGHSMDPRQVCTCVSCQAGSYKPSDGNQPCEPCELGKYQDSSGASSCIQCQGCTDDATTYGRASNCVPCLTGTYAVTTYIDGWLEQHYTLNGDMVGITYMGFDALTPVVTRRVSPLIMSTQVLGLGSKDNGVHDGELSFV